MKKFFFDCGTRDATASFGILALRIMIGLMMLCGHGISKIQDFQKLMKGFYVPDFFPLYYMSPSVSLIACITAEVGASILIILGVATRPAAFVLGFNMVVAAFAVHGAAPWILGPGVPVAKEPALLYLIPAIVIILTGAGAFSLDAGIYKEGKRRRW
jgi:putative oxidoreductase